MVTNANDNAMYQLAELDETRMTVPVGGKWIKVFKKWQEAESDPEDEDKDDEPNEDWIGDGSEEDE